MSGAGDFVRGYLDETVTAVRGLDAAAIDAMAVGLARVREQGGRLFILGVGGSAGHASHAVNDFRKICGFESYSPTDNVSELTARVNDEGWDTTFSEWLKVSRLSKRDGVLVAALGAQLVRMVTHHDATRAECEEAAGRVRELGAG